MPEHTEGSSPAAAPVAQDGRGSGTGPDPGAQFTEPPRATQTRLGVWLLLGAKGGDNSQLGALAEGLAQRFPKLPIVEKRLTHKPWELLVHLRDRPTLAGVATGADTLTPPWPKVVVTAGRRNEPVARWIAEQSGGATRLVFVGRPWSSPEHFALILSTPQYELEGPNVEVLRLPLVPPAPDAGELVPPPRLSRLPEPRFGVLLGGDSGFLLYDARHGEELAARLDRLIIAHGGSLLLTSSRRTPTVFLDALVRRLRATHQLHRFGAADNPYPWLLAHADALIVTADSMSMLAEAVAGGRPTYVASVAEPADNWWVDPAQYRWRALSHRVVQRFAPERFRRDVRVLQQRLQRHRVIGNLEDLLAAGAELGAGLDPTRAKLSEADRATAVDRVGRLLAGL